MSLELPLPNDEAVIDASVIVEFVLGGSAATAIGERLKGLSLHAPAHVDAEVLSAIGRIHRSGAISARDARTRLEHALVVPVVRHELPKLINGAWQRRQRFRLVDALYVELADQLSTPLLTTDVALGRATSIAEVLST